MRNLLRNKLHSLLTTSSSRRLAFIRTAGSKLPYSISGVLLFSAENTDENEMRNNANIFAVIYTLVYLSDYD